MMQFTLGTALRFLATFRDSSGNAYDPSSTWGLVWDSSSTVVGSISTLTRVSTGNYYADWQSMPGSCQSGRVSWEAAGFSGVLVYRRRAAVAELV